MKYSIKYLIIGKFGAILYGYPGTTQDIDIFPDKEKSNCQRLVAALKELGFDLNEELQGAILAAKDFIQIRGGPFPIDIVFAPDGIKSFEDATSGRQRDKEELPRLELFREELKKRKT
ncbi:MAG: hypothetical protein ABSG71_06290 [Thermodesulfobacteriota bacterium]